MKSLSYLLISFFLFTMFTIQAQDEQQQEGKQKIATDQVEVYYFHNTRRCATCEAIEEVTKASLNEFYPEQVKSGTVIFKSLNIEEEANEDLAKRIHNTVEEYPVFVLDILTNKANSRYIGGQRTGADGCH